MMTLERCIKTICSSWELGTVADSMNSKGEIFKTYYIISNGNRPTKDDYDAISKYSGCKYKYGFFYEKYK